MGQGGLIYKGMSKQMGYQNELMKLQNDLAIQYSEVYGDADKGMIAQYLKAANEGAEKEGEQIKEDAKNTLTQAIVGSVAIVATAGMGVVNYKGGGKIDDQVEDLQAQKDALNSPADNDLSMHEPADPLKLTPSEKEFRENVNNRVNDWKNGKFDKYKIKIDADDAKQENFKESKINEAAVQKARAEARDAVNEKLDKQISDLKAERSKLDNQFQQFTQFSNLGRESIVSMATTKNTFDKHEEATAATQKRAEAQILQTVGQQESGFISQAKQDAAQDQQAADSIAASYASIRNVQG